MLNINFALLTDTATVPTRKHESDAGIDLYSDKNCAILPGEVMVVSTGVTVEIPKGFFGWITNKSKNNFLIGGGIVDSGYQGELLVKIVNPSNNDVHIKQGGAIAQLLIIPCVTPKVAVSSVEDVHKNVSDRGASGGITRQYWQERAEKLDETICVDDKNF